MSDRQISPEKESYLTFQYADRSDFWSSQSAFARNTRGKSELLQKADVIFDEEANVVNAVFSHGDAFDAEAKGPAGEFVGVDFYGFEDVGMDHSAAAELDPSAFSAGEIEPDVDLGGGLGEREKTGAEAHAGFFAEIGLDELVN